MRLLDPVFAWKSRSLIWHVCWCFRSNRICARVLSTLLQKEAAICDKKSWVAWESPLPHQKKKRTGHENFTIWRAPNWAHKSRIQFFPRKEILKRKAHRQMQMFARATGAVLVFLELGGKLASCHLPMSAVDPMTSTEKTGEAGSQPANKDALRQTAA